MHFLVDSMAAQDWGAQSDLFISSTSPRVGPLLCGERKGRASSLCLAHLVGFSSHLFACVNIRHIICG